jgi:hypothetical protein
MTPTLRPHDAGILEISAFVDKSQVIPPYQPKFVTTGFCPKACMHEVMFDIQTIINPYVMFRCNFSPEGVLRYATV